MYVRKHSSQVTINAVMHIQYSGTQSLVLINKAQGTTICDAIQLAHSLGVCRLVSVTYYELFQQQNKCLIDQGWWIRM